ncbi:MAG: hypothetical protein QOJ08_1407 [Ilumatobacteraceae bacterium]
MGIGITWGEGDQIEGTPFRVVVPGSDTSRHAVVLTVDMPPGLHVDAHNHETEEQINIVVSGQVRFRVGAEEAEIYTPPGMEQKFAAAGTAAVAGSKGFADADDYANSRSTRG